MQGRKRMHRQLRYRPLLASPTVRFAFAHRLINCRRVRNCTSNSSWTLNPEQRKASKGFKVEILICQAVYLCIKLYFGVLGSYARLCCIQLHGNISIAYITPELLNDPITIQTCLGESGEEIVKWVDAYKFEVSCVDIVAICVLIDF